MPHENKAKIVVTLRPASSSPNVSRALLETGADVFRLNVSQGSHDEHRHRCGLIRALEEERGRPSGVLADLQGPKIRVGRPAAGPLDLGEGERVRFDLDFALGLGVNWAALSAPGFA